MSEVRAEVWKDGHRVWTVMLFDTPNAESHLPISERSVEWQEPHKDFASHHEALAWAIQETHRPPLGATVPTPTTTQEDTHK